MDKPGKAVAAMLAEGRLPTTEEIYEAAEVLCYAAENNGDGATGVQDKFFVVLLAVPGQNDPLAQVLTGLYEMTFEMEEEDV